MQFVLKNGSRQGDQVLLKIDYRGARMLANEDYQPYDVKGSNQV